MWLTNVSIRRPVFIIMTVLALIVLGFTARKKMQVELNPKVDIPYISVVTVYPGAGPQEIETLVSKPIEEAVSSISNLKNVTTTSQDGISVTAMEFELGTSLDAAAADVRDKLSAIRGSLPKDIIEPTVSKLNISSQPIITMALKGNMSPRDLRTLADKTVKDYIGKAKGIAAVSVSGGQVREVSVAVDKDRLQAYGLSINQVAQAMQAENLNLPSGAIKEGPDGESMRNYAVRTVGEFKNADEISNIMLHVAPNGNLPGGTIRLGDIATVKDSVADADVISKLNGNPAVTIAVQKQSDANTVESADAVKKQIEQLNGSTKMVQGKKVVTKGILPPGVKLTLITDDSKYVKDSMADVNESLLEGILLVVLIVFIFLHSGRATLIVALAIPTSIIATFLPMKACGFTMNMMTMLALSLCVGILVDDSIVVLENIERHLRKGEKPADAALNGRSEIGLAAVTITLVDVVVFVPIAFMGGIVGQFFRQFGITIAIATLFSLFMSFTLTPMLSSRWLKSKEQEEADEVRSRGHLFNRFFARFEAAYSAIDSRYRGVLAWALENRGLTIAIGISALFTVIGMTLPTIPDLAHADPKMRGAKMFMLLLSVGLPVLFGLFSKAKKVGLGYAAVAFILVGFINFPLGGEFMPATDNGQFAISIELPAGKGLDATNKVAEQVEALLPSIQGMKYYQTTVGAASAGHFGGDTGNQYGQIAVTLEDRGKTRPQPIKDVIAELGEKTALIPGATIRVSNQGQSGPGGAPIQMEVTGANQDEIIRVAQEAQDVMAKIPGVVDIKSSWDAGKPEMKVTVDRQRAADLGISVAQIAGALRTSIEGNTDSKLRDQGDEFNIRVQLAKSDRQDTNDIANVIIGSQNGAPIYLRDVAKVELAAAPNKYERKNRQRLITITANTAYGAKQGNVQQAVSKALEKINTGSARIGTGGSSQMMMESFAMMLSALALAILLVYMLMGALFESFITPLVIMFSLPQALVGALLALMVTGHTFSIVTMIGIIMLVGLVTKNAILLIDYTNTLRESGMKRNDAILEAGPTRLRPIMMTTFAMVGGMMPTALALSRGSEMRAPMAVAVIGGLILSTLLTLLVIPTSYTIVDDIWTAVRRMLGYKLAPSSHGMAWDESKELIDPVVLDEDGVIK